MLRSTLIAALSALALTACAPETSPSSHVKLDPPSTSASSGGGSSGTADPGTGGDAGAASTTSASSGGGDTGGAGGAELPSCDDGDASTTDVLCDPANADAWALCQARTLDGVTPLPCDAGRCLHYNPQSGDAFTPFNTLCAPPGVTSCPPSGNMPKNTC